MKLSLALTLAICCLINITNAQVFPHVAPSDVDDVTDMIFDLHGGSIDLTYAEVNDFLADLLPATNSDPAFNPNCLPPSPSVSGFTASTVSLDWSLVPTALSYRGSFLHLNSTVPGGETGSQTTTGTNLNFNVSDGLILMAFQSRCTIGSTGKLEIIIVEKPIMSPDSVLGCKCKKPKIGQLGSFDVDGEMVNLSFTHSGDVGYYFGTIDYDPFSDGEVSYNIISNFVIEVDFSNDEQYYIRIDPNCSHNMDSPGTGVLYSSYIPYLGESESYLGSLTFTNDFIVFDPIEGVSGEILLRECPELNPANLRAKETVSSIPLNVKTLSSSPNPARSSITFTTVEDILKETNQFYLTDAFGNRLDLPSSLYRISERNVDLNISSLPAGIYNFIIQNGNEIMENRFVKIN